MAHKLIYNSIVCHNDTIVHSPKLTNTKGSTMATNAERKETRLVARTSTEIQEIIQRAADYTGATLSQFLIEAAMSKACDVIEHAETLHLSMASADALFASLDNPPKASKKLIKAAMGYKDVVNARHH
jgi:uncharacterized protein (DUF1778 family)